MTVTVHIASVGAVAARLMERILCCSLRLDVRVHETWTRSDALGLAGTLISPLHEEPAAVVLDSDTLEDAPLREQRNAAEHLLTMAWSGVPFHLVLAVPQVEAVLFHDRAGLERALGRKLADEDAFEARFRPKAVLRRLLGDGGDPGVRVEEVDGDLVLRNPVEERALGVVDALDDAALAKMAAHPVIREIAGFVAEAGARGDRAPAPVRRAG